MDVAKEFEETTGLESSFPVLFFLFRDVGKSQWNVRVFYSLRPVLRPWAAVLLSFRRGAWS